MEGSEVWSLKGDDEAWGEAISARRLGGARRHLRKATGYGLGTKKLCQMARAYICRASRTSICDIFRNARGHKPEVGLAVLECHSTSRDGLALYASTVTRVALLNHHVHQKS